MPRDCLVPARAPVAPRKETVRRRRSRLLAASLPLMAVLVLACAADPPGANGGGTGGRRVSGSGGRGGDGAFGGADGQTPVERHGQLAVSGSQLVGAHGAPVQLKGPSSMWLNWETSGYARNRQGLRFLRDDWRATVVRAAMGIEPAGAFLANPAKAREDVRAVVENAVELGMYVIIDWHDHNAHMHQAQAVAFFTEMAQQYGHLPNVLYEPFNEPEQVLWGTTLKPYHEAVVAAIRAVDPDNVIILGTPNWSQDADLAAALPVAGANLMYTLHFYSCTHGVTYRAKGITAMARGAALFVTEWGATHSDGGTPANPTLCLSEAQQWHDWMTDRSISWTAWKLDDCADQTCYFRAGTPATGSWTDAQLNGHAAFVRDRMRE